MHQRVAAALEDQVLIHKEDRDALAIRINYWALSGRILMTFDTKNSKSNQILSQIGPSVLPTDG
jgi:hypothetical protein